MLSDSDRRNYDLFTTIAQGDVVLLTRHDDDSTFIQGRVCDTRTVGALKDSVEIAMVGISGWYRPHSWQVSVVKRARRLPKKAGLFVTRGASESLSVAVVYRLSHAGIWYKYGSGTTGTVIYPDDVPEDLIPLLPNFSAAMGDCNVL